MYSDRSGEVFNELHQPAVRTLWKSVNLELKHPAKATFLTSQSASQIIEIFGLVVTPSWIQYRISSVEPAFTVTRILKKFNSGNGRSCNLEILFRGACLPR